MPSSTRTLPLSNKRIKEQICFTFFQYPKVFATNLAIPLFFWRISKMAGLEELGNQEILEAFFQGDRTVDGVLLDRLWSSVVTCARKVVTDVSRSQYSGGMNLDAEEATNQTLTEFMEAMAKENRSFRNFAWLHLIRYLRRRVTFRILDQNRRWNAGRRLGGQIKSFEDILVWCTEKGEPLPFDPPSSSNEKPEIFDKVHGCLDRLKPTEREMFQRKHLDETTQAELALDYGMPQGTVAVRLMRIVVRLRDCLKRSGVTSNGRFKI
jgi:RNA polymerase sigma factor (sigma-70 family)